MAGSQDKDMDRRHFQEFVFETSSNELSAVPPFFEWSDFFVGVLRSGDSSVVSSH